MLNSTLSIPRLVPTLCLLTSWCMCVQAQNKQLEKNSIHDSLTIREVVVTAKQTSFGANHVGQQLGSTAITQSMGTSLASLLEGVSGMSSIQTGTKIGRASCRERV